MKKLFSIIVTILIILSFTVSSLAIGDGNIDGGGGDMGSGTGTNNWNVGDDGVRVTIINIKTQSPAKAPVDFSNRKIRIDYYGGYNSKIAYRNGKGFSPKIGSNYKVNKSTSRIPDIISPSGASNIAEIKRYFTSEGFLKDLCIATCMPYETLINGDYKLLLEPIAYFTYNGVRYAATAHEASMLDVIKKGDLTNKIGQLTRKNLPLSMFLETPDLGFLAWSGTTSDIVSNRDIQTSLGIGIVKFKEGENPQQHPQQSDVEYRTNTEVITSFTATATRSTNPDNPASVTMTTSTGQSHTFNVELKNGTSQLVWIKWTTPEKACNVTISAKVNGDLTLDKNTINAKITDLSTLVPPNPEGRDRNNGFTVPMYKDKMTNCKSLNWKTYSAWLDTKTISSESLPTDDEWFTIQKYYRTKTYYVNGKKKKRKVFDRQKIGCWKYTQNDWYATLTVPTSKIYPDEKVPTAIKKGLTYQMKSGYGIDANIQTNVTTNGIATAGQSVVALFPEFNYDTYCRLLVPENKNSLARMFHFQNNPYSRFEQPVHFTPLWYPDMEYKVYFLVFDAWTPAGQLSQTVSDSIKIKGDCYDDWHIGLIYDK